MLNFYFHSSVQSLSHFPTPWTAAQQASLSITNSQSLLKLMFIKLVMPSNHLILCRLFSSCLQFFPASGFFQWVSSLRQVAKVLELQLGNWTEWPLRWFPPLREFWFRDLGCWLKTVTKILSNVFPVYLFLGSSSFILNYHWCLVII